MISIFFWAFFIALHLSPCFSQDAIDDFAACGVVYNCGDLVNITYPFWGNERQGFCGRRELELKCKDNQTTTIQINSMEFNVLEINQSEHRMRIARSDLYEDYCPKYQIEPITTLNHHLLKYSMNDRNITVWYDCAPQRGIPEDFRFWCGWEGENNSGRENYVLEQDEAKNWSEYSRNCRIKIEVTVMVDVLEEWRNNKTMLVETALKQGFNVEYDGDSYTVACEECEQSGGACGSNATRKFYCNCRNGDIQPYICDFHPKEPKFYKWKKLVIGATPAGGLILIIFIIIISIYCKRKRISNEDKTTEEIIRMYSTQTPKRYSYSELKKITDSFKNKLGHGGFSTVYKGKLPSGGCDVAVKVLNASTENGQDFINEVVSSARTSHINIVTLLGFCYEQKKRALIYEYMPKGSLDKYIFHQMSQKEGVKLDWNTLYNIVIGVARGLEYLHRGCNTRILHFDIKPHNILLDNEFCPKISDFGLAKQCRGKESHVSMTGVKGTIGFIAPEVIFRNLGKVSHKSDVYSYGMLVLEMVGERKSPNEGGVEQISSEEYFPDWIYKDLTQSEIDGGRWWSNSEEEVEKVRKMIIVGLHCIQTLPDDRPSMTDVVVMLEGSVDALQIPPKPNLFRPPTTELPLISSSSSNPYK